MKLRAVPLTLKAANAHVAAHHRHNKPVRGHFFSVGVLAGSKLVGVAMLGRPVARGLDDGTTAEALRVCVEPGAPKGACSFLYAALWRAYRAIGGLRAVTYTLQRECGASLRGAGWRPVAQLEARNPAEWVNRGGARVVQAVTAEPKIRWEVTA